MKSGWALMAALLLAGLLISFAAAIPYRGYSHTRQVMSVLGCKASPLRSVYMISELASPVRDTYITPVLTRSADFRASEYELDGCTASDSEAARLIEKMLRRCSL